MSEGLLRTVVFDLFNDQRRDDFAFFDFACLGVFFVVKVFGRSAQRQYRNRLGVCFVNIVLDGVFDLRWQVVRGAGVPKRFAATHHGRGKFAKQRDGVRTHVHGVLTANGLNLAFVSTTNRDAHAVATNQATAFVGDRVSRGLGIEAFMHKS